MRWQWVVNQRGYAAFVQMFLQNLARCAAHNKHMPHRRVVRAHHRQRNLRMVNLAQILRGDIAAALIISVDAWQLHAQQSRLQFIKAAVHPFIKVFVFAMRAVIAQRAQRIRQRIIVGGYSTRIAQRTQIFAGEKTVPRRIAQRPRSHPRMKRAVRLRAIFNNLQSVFARNGVDRRHIRCLPIKMYRQNRARARAYVPLNQRCVQITRGIRLHQYRRQTVFSNCQYRGDVGVGRHDHFIAQLHRAKLQPCTQNQHQRFQAIAHAHAMFCATVCSVLALEGFDFFAQHIPAAIDYAGEGGYQRSAVACIDGE